MAEKVVAIKIDVQGTADQKRKLEGLEKTLQGLTEQQRKLKKLILGSSVICMRQKPTQTKLKLWRNS